MFDSLHTALGRPLARLNQGMQRISVRIGLAIAALLVLCVGSQLGLSRLLVNVYADPIRTGLFNSSLSLASALAEELQDTGGWTQARNRAMSVAAERDFCKAFYSPAGQRTGAQHCAQGVIPEVLSREMRMRARAQRGRPVLLRSERLAEPPTLVLARPDRAGGGFVGIRERAPHRLLSVRAESVASMTIVLAAVVIAIALLATWVVVARLRSSIREVQAVVHRIAEGDLERRLPKGHDDELGALAQDFNRMADRLQQLVEALRGENLRRRSLFAALSHELNTPLTSVLGYLESLQKADIAADPEMRTRHVQVAYAQAHALATLVDDLDTASRLDVGDLSLRVQPHGFSALITREVEALAPRAATARVRLQFDSEVEDDWAELDPHRLAQVLRNLLDNALRYAPQESVIRILLSGDDYRLRVAVSDEGAGMPDTVRQRAGEWLLRADPSRTRGTGGRGLGLAIARGLVQAHGGELGVATGGAGGTTVEFWLPRAPSQP